ncbi:hypothetical protein CDAR_523691 [Caerostris darwini]|uniref:Uncharacterized protein n=1 Tax=Caerostris darwini TaxID=1538125 RepID=A0AAV4TQY2_9ARAC|nr:hypothetical protein CDAR_523691 [Caerostris darwini]
MPHGPENQYNSTPLPNADQLNPMPVAEPCSLPGFQQAFGQRNTLMNQIHQRPNASCQMESSGTSRTDVMSSSFTFDFNEIDHASTNQISQHYETSSGIPILEDQNAQYNPMDPVPPTDASGPIHSKIVQKNSFRKITWNLKINLIVLRDHMPAVIVTEHFLAVPT